MSSQTNINFFTSDRWSISFSNIPTVEESVKDLQFLYENFIKSVSLPEYALEITQSMYKGNVINHVVSKKNDSLNDLTIGFKLDENFQNYFNLYEYIQRVRYGEQDITPSNQVRNTFNKRKELARDYDIDSINILLLNNERIAKKILSFEACIITSLSNISLQFGVADAVDFSVTFKYRECHLRDA